MIKLLTHNGSTVRPARGISYSALRAICQVLAVCAVAAAAEGTATALDADVLRNALGETEQALGSGCVVEYRLREVDSRIHSPPPAKILAMMPNWVSAQELNRVSDVAERLVWSVRLRQWKFVATDLREPSAVLRGKAAGALDWDAACMSKETLLGDDVEHMVAFFPREHGNRAIVVSLPSKTQRTASLRTGCVPAAVAAANGGIEWREAQHEGRPAYDLVVRGESFDATYRVDPAIGYRCREAHHRAKDGRLLRTEVWSEYRTVNGIAFPHRYEERKWNPDGTIAVESERLATTVQLNVEVPASDLQIEVPAGTSITMTAGEDTGVVTSRQPMSVNLKNALDVGVIIAKQPFGPPDSLSRSGRSGALTPPPKKGGTAEVLTSRPATQPAADAPAK